MQANDPRIQHHIPVSIAGAPVYPGHIIIPEPQRREALLSPQLPWAIALTADSRVWLNHSIANFCGGAAPIVAIKLRPYVLGSWVRREGFSLGHSEDMLKSQATDFMLAPRPLNMERPIDRRKFALSNGEWAASTPMPFRMPDDYLPEPGEIWEYACVPGGFIVFHEHWKYTGKHIPRCDYDPKSGMPVQKDEILNRMESILKPFGYHSAGGCGCVYPFCCDGQGWCVTC